MIYNEVFPMNLKKLFLEENVGGFDLLFELCLECLQ